MNSSFDFSSYDHRSRGGIPDLQGSHVVNPYRGVLTEGCSRRSFFKRTVGQTVAGLLTAEFLASRRGLAQTTLSPDAALQALMDGNRRFSLGRLTSFEHDLAILRQHTVDKQEPFAAVLACADSRVPVELVFDQTIGHIFVARVAGNVASSVVIASLEYAAAVLGTKVIIVMGHSGCGAVKATIQGKEAPGQISALYSYIQPAANQAGPDLEAAAKANAKIQAALLRQASTVISTLVKEKKLKVVAALYDVGTGKVSLLT